MGGVGRKHIYSDSVRDTEVMDFPAEMAGVPINEKDHRSLKMVHSWHEGVPQPFLKGSAVDPPI